MKYVNLLLISLVVMLLAGCNAGGPSSAQAKEVIYGVYFKDASILGKRQCELTSKMEEEGQTSVWLIRYKFDDSGTTGAMLIGEGDSEEYPWMPYMTMAGLTEEAIEQSCP
jgi:hypothetical protein